MATISTDTVATGKVRAKFYVSEVALTGWGCRVTMNAVTRGEDNKEWSAATPSGTLTMQIKNDLAAEQFAPGQEWFLDFTPTVKDREGMDAVA